MRVTEKEYVKKINNDPQKLKLKIKIFARSSLEYSGSQVGIPSFAFIFEVRPTLCERIRIINFFFRATHICRLCCHYGNFIKRTLTSRFHENTFCNGGLRRCFDGGKQERFLVFFCISWEY